jgi:hypothetical protein
LWQFCKLHKLLLCGFSCGDRRRLLFYKQHKQILASEQLVTDKQPGSLFRRVEAREIFLLYLLNSEAESIFQQDAFEIRVQEDTASCRDDSWIAVNDVLQAAANSSCSHLQWFFFRGGSDRLCGYRR